MACHPSLPKLGLSRRSRPPKARVECRIDSTPLLDRLIPLPPAAPLRSEHGSALRGAIRGAIIGISVVVALAYGFSPSAIGQWLSARFTGWPLGIRFAWVVVAAPAGLLAATVAHELGHVLAGLCLGFRFGSIRVGRLRVTRPFRWSWSRTVTRRAAGAALMLPIGTYRLARRAFGMIAGGPAANLVTAGAIAWLPFDKGPFMGSVLLYSLIAGTINLLPFRRGTFVSDGRRLVTLVRRPLEARRWLAVLVLSAEMNDGIEPEALSPDFIAAAIAVRDDSLDTIAGHRLAYLARFYQHDDARAAEALEVCLSHAGHVPEAMRESLKCEAAVFQASRRARPDLAEAWLDDVPSETTLPGIRLEAEAAILEARGNRAGARQTLARLEALLRERPAVPARDTALRLLRRWQTDLEREC